MIGAIIGDIVGSRFEHKNHRSKDFELFTNNCRPTDDSIMSLAIAKAILDSRKDYSELPQNAVISMQELGRKYKTAGYGKQFLQWILSSNPQPYESYGNGAAMRVGPCGYASKSIEEVKVLSTAVTTVTHNHPEGVKGAEAVSVAIFLARNGENKDTIKDIIQKWYYSIDFTVDQIRKSYKFDPTCQGSVPVALEAFFEAEDFEDAIRNAISVGGDSDTIASIAGAIAEAYFGVPEQMIIAAFNRLDDFEKAILYAFEKEFQSKAVDQNGEFTRTVFDVINEVIHDSSEETIQNVIKVATDDREFLEETQYTESIELHYRQIPEAAKPVLQEAKNLLTKIEKALYTSSAFINVVKASIPDIELQAVLTDQQKQQLAEGTLKLLSKKDGSLLASLINPETHRIVAEIPLESVKKTPQMTQAMASLSAQMQLAQIAEQIQDVQRSVEEIRLGQESDRLALAYSCQQRLIQALEIKNPSLREMALMQLASSAEDSRNTLMLSQKNNVDYIKNQPEGFLQKVLAKTTPDEINKRMDEVRENLCAVNMASFTEAIAYKELGEVDAARKSLEYYVKFLETTYISVPGLLQRLDMIDPAPTNYWTKMLPSITTKIKALPGMSDIKSLENYKPQE